MSTSGSNTYLETLAERLDFVQRAGRIGIWEWDVGKSELVWTDEVFRIHDFPDEIPSFEAWQQTIHPADRQQVLDNIERCLQTGAEYDVQFRVIWRDGSTHWIATRGGVQRDESGTPIRMVGLTFDITDRVRAEEALHEKEHELQVITDAIPAQIAYINRDLRYEFTNRYYESVFGKTPEQLRGVRLADVLGEQFEQVRPYMETALRGEEVRYQITLRHPKSGTPWHVQVQYIPDRRDGTIRGFFVLVSDVTKLREAEDALRNSEKLATAGRLAATIAHEINNPLEAVTNLVFLAKSDPALSDGAKEFLQLAEVELRRVHHIVNQTLVFYRDPTTPTELDLRQKLEGILALFQRKIQAKNLRVDADLENAGSIRALPGELRQVFSNIIANAIDAAPIGGSILVRARRHKRIGKREGVRIMIGDNGAGISPENRRRIFEPFFTTKLEVGTGLGLWVANGIIKKHGGKIRVHSSQTRHRTIFTVVLPRESAALKIRAGA